MTALGATKFLGVPAVQFLRSDKNSLEAWFYRIEALGHVPEALLHTELHVSRSDVNVRFELSWISMREARELLGDADCLMLKKALNLAT